MLLLLNQSKNKLQSTVLLDAILDNYLVAQNSFKLIFEDERPYLSQPKIKNRADNKRKNSEKKTNSMHNHRQDPKAKNKKRPYDELVVNEMKSPKNKRKFSIK